MKRWRSSSWRIRHINLSLAMALSLMGAVVIAVAAAWLLAHLLNVGTQRTSPTDLTKLALTIAAGVGGVVALVVAYRRQRDLEQGRFVEAFGAAAKQLGDPDVAVRLAGVYAMAGVADQESKLKRQQCIDVLCAYLRLPYSPELGNNHQSALLIRKPMLRKSGSEEEIQFQYRQNDKVVRQTIVRVIAAHLQPKASHSWSSNDFDFTGSHLEQASFGGVVLCGIISFTDATFSGDSTSFAGATFSSGTTSFDRATFNSETTSFERATFNSETTSFERATFSGGTTSFERATFSGGTTSFERATFSSEDTWFRTVIFSGGTTSFDRVTFSGDGVSFAGAIFSSDRTWFPEATFSSDGTSFDHATFSGRDTSFDQATFSGRDTWFDSSTFSGQSTSFYEATFSGEITTFKRVTFSSEETSFSEVTFSSGHTSFFDVDFGVGAITFEDPKAWNPAPVFDWDAESAVVILKPENVEPRNWPPVVKQIPEDQEPNRESAARSGL